MVRRILITTCFSSPSTQREFSQRLYSGSEIWSVSSDGCQHRLTSPRTCGQGRPHGCGLLLRAPQLAGSVMLIVSMLCFCCLEILSNFQTRNPAFHFALGPKLPTSYRYVAAPASEAAEPVQQPLSGNSKSTPQTTPGFSLAAHVLLLVSSVPKVCLKVTCILTSCLFSW